MQACISLVQLVYLPCIVSIMTLYTITISFFFITTGLLYAFFHCFGESNKGKNDINYIYHFFLDWESLCHKHVLGYSLYFGLIWHALIRIKIVLSWRIIIRYRKEISNKKNSSNSMRNTSLYTPCTVSTFVLYNYCNALIHYKNKKISLSKINIGIFLIYFLTKLRWGKGSSF